MLTGIEEDDDASFFLYSLPLLYFEMVAWILHLYLHITVSLSLICCVLLINVLFQAWHSCLCHNSFLYALKCACGGIECKCN